MRKQPNYTLVQNATTKVASHISSQQLDGLLKDADAGWKTAVKKRDAVRLALELHKL